MALIERGMLCKGTHKHTIRVALPLVIDAAEVDLAVEHAGAVLR